MSNIELIKKLSDAFGPSGFEDDVCEIVKNELKDFKNVEEDTLRNVRCELKNNSGNYTVMLDSHMDEVGLVVQAIKPNGTMRFITLGGFALPTLPTSTFNIKNTDGNLITSVVASKPVHFMSEQERNNPSLSISNMVLDCGATSDEEVLNDYKIKIASPAVANVKCTYNEKTKMFFGKAFDCRIGVAAMIETLKRLNEKKLAVDVKASFSTQEEVGGRGIINNIKKINPKIAICFEGCPADDNFQESYMIQSAINKGCMLRNVDITMITNPRFQKFAVDIANKYNIKIQESVRSGGGTNGGEIHLHDIPTIVISIPVRYIHSNHCFCSLNDYESAVELAVKLCESLNNEIIDSF